MLATDGEMTFAIFLYNELQWTRADGSSSPAHVGFNDGILKSFNCNSSCIDNCCKVSITIYCVNCMARMRSELCY